MAERDEMGALKDETPGAIEGTAIETADPEPGSIAGTSNETPDPDAGKGGGGLSTESLSPRAKAEPVVESLTGRQASNVEETDAAEKRAAELGVDITTVEGTGLDGRVLVADVEAAAAAGTSSHDAV